MTSMEREAPTDETKERVLPYPFWVGLAACATPDVLSQLLQTTRAARNAVVQSAATPTLTARLSAPPAPDTLSLLRTSGRTLLATVTIENDNEQHTPRVANHFVRLLIPRLACAAITRLCLEGRPARQVWLVDGGLLQDIHDSLPGLKELDLFYVSTPAHPYAYPASIMPGLASVKACVPLSQSPEGMAALLAALGVRSGGRVAHLSLFEAYVTEDDTAVALNRHIGAVLSRVLQDNHLHALRKLHLPGTTIWPDTGYDAMLSALIHNAPALEHLHLAEVMSWRGHASASVPRILQVDSLEISDWDGLPLGSRPDQPPLIVRVRTKLDTGRDWDAGDDAVAHLTSTAAGHRQVRLECTPDVYNDSLVSSQYLDILFRMLTLTRFGLSNLILDGIDTAAGLKGLVKLTSLTITLDTAEWNLDTEEVQAGLLELPHVTKFELFIPIMTRHGIPGNALWLCVEPGLLAALPSHITEVCLWGEPPSVELVTEMCVQVSRLPHRQACPLRLCVPDVPGWLDALRRALNAAGIQKSGVLGMP